MAVDQGYGITIGFGTSSFSAEVIEDVDASPVERTAIETTHHAVTGGYRTYIPGDLIEPGGFSFRINYDTDVQPPIADVAEVITLTFNPAVGETVGATLVCTGFLTSWTWANPIDDRRTANIDVKFTGVPVWTDAS